MRAGDEAAARRLFERHLPALRAKVRARLPAALRGKVAESDVIQDAWLAAFLDVGNFEDRDDGSFGRRLRGILDHKIGHAIGRHVAAGRRDARRERRVRTGSFDGLGAAPGQASPSDEAVSAEEQEVLRAAVASLSADHATVVRLVRVEGLTLVDAGRHMDRSADAARKLYGRATAAMAAKLRGARDAP